MARTSTHSLSEQELKAIWAKALREDDYPTFAEHFLWIQTKEHGLQRLKPWKHQLQMSKDRARLVQLGLFLWRLYLKYRQGGFTVWFLGEDFFQTIRNQDFNCLILAHEKDLPTELLDRVRVFLDNMPDWAKPSVKKDSSSEIVFGGYTAEDGTFTPLRSSLRIGTAKTHMGGAGVKIGRTLHRIHITEAAQNIFTNGKLVELFNTVPTRCEVVVESTANGIGNWFYDTYWDGTKGEGGFHVYFVPWTVHEEYTLPVPRNFKPDDQNAKKLGIDDEQQLMEEYGLTPGQLVWRRWKVAQGKKDLAKFKEQYPLTDVEAFMQSGQSMFSQSDLAYMMDSDKFVKDWPTRRGALRYVDGQFEFTADEDGSLAIYRDPDPRKTYILTADIGDGLTNGDPSAVDVWCKQDNEQVAQWHGRVSPNDLAYIINTMGRYYNCALAVPEVNNMGGHTTTVLSDTLGYPNIFYREATGTIDPKASTRRYGWHTSAPSKKLMVAALQHHIANWDETNFRVHSATTIREFMTFIADHTKQGNERYAAQQGCYDDTVITAGIFLRVADSPQAYDRPESTEDSHAEFAQAAKLAGIHTTREPESRYDRAMQRARQGTKEWGQA